MRSTSARNSLSGRTFDRHIQNNRKVARLSSRSRTSVVAGLALEQLLQRLGLVGRRCVPSHTRIEISDGSGTRATSSGTMSCTEIFGGAFSSGSTRPRTSTALSSSSIGEQPLVLRGEHHALRRAQRVLELHRRPRLAFLIALRWMPVSTPQIATSASFVETFQIVAVVRGQLADLVHVLHRADGR